MLIQQLNRTDPENIVISVLNSSDSSLTTGMGAALVQAGVSTNGIDVVAVTTATVEGFCGVARSDIAANAFGLVIAWGFAASVAISQSVGSFTITRGDMLRVSGDAGHFTSVITDQAISTQLYHYIIAAGANADTISNPRVTMSGIVRAI